MPFINVTHHKEADISEGEFEEMLIWGRDLYYNDAKGLVIQEIEKIEAKSPLEIDNEVSIIIKKAKRKVVTEETQEETYYTWQIYYIISAFSSLALACYLDCAKTHDNGWMIVGLYESDQKDLEKLITLAEEIRQKSQKGITEF